MQIHRLTEIVFSLLKNQRVTARELAARFEVSARTIYRDIDVLSGAGIPVFTDKGNGGGITIAENYRLDNALLSDGEKQNIITMLTAFHASVNDGETAALLKKLSGVFQTSNHFIEVDFSDWDNDSGVQETFDVLQKCIVEKNVASVNYRNAAGDVQERELEPLKLIFKHRDWYLYAYCRKRGECRLFKLARVGHIERLEQKFDRVCTETNVARKLEWSGDNVEVTLKISGEMKNRVYDMCMKQPLRIDHNGDFIMKNKFPINDWVIGYFLSFGDRAEIVEPLWLRDKIKEIHSRAANR